LTTVYYITIIRKRNGGNKMIFKVKVQINAREIKIIEVEADNEKSAWEKASEFGVVTGFKH